MPLECQIPLVELKEAFCELDQAPEDEAVQSVLHLVEESIEFAGLISSLQRNNVRLVSIDFSSYPFTETSDFLSSVVLTEFPRTDDQSEEWSLPFQQNIVDDLIDMTYIFGVEPDRPDLVVLGALRANRLFNAFLREVEQSKQMVGIRGATLDLYRCLGSRPLVYNQALRRRLAAPIETFAAKVYDEEDNASIMQFEVRYDDLQLVKVADGDSKKQALQFGWESLITPPYDKIHGLSWQNSAPATRKFQELTCLIPRRLSPLAFAGRQPDAEEFAGISLSILDDMLCFMKKFEQLKKNNLKLALVNTYRTPHEVYDEDFAEDIHRSLNILVSFDAYMENFVAEEKKNSDSYDHEGCLYYCETQLEDARYEQIEINLNLPDDVVEELKNYAHYIPIPKERMDLVVAGLILLFDSSRVTLHQQRCNAVEKMEPGYRVAIRGLQDDLTRFESAYGRSLADFGNARVVDTGASVAVMNAWPVNAPHPIDVPVYIEIGGDVSC